MSICFAIAGKSVTCKADWNNTSKERNTQNGSDSGAKVSLIFV